jgi:hypothetical protein
MNFVDNISVVSETSKILIENHSNWVNRYKKLAQRIEENEEKYRYVSKLFHTPGSLDTFTSMTRPGENTIDLRFAGLSIGEITAIDKDNITLEVSAAQAKYAHKLDDLQNCQEFSATEWHNKKASDYRSFYKKQSSTREVKEKIGKSLKEEVRIEHWILAEIRRHSNNLLCNISPVMLCGHFFKMPVPLNASGHIIPPEYKSASYGYMDIFARVKHGSNKDNRLAVIELKDENQDGESQCLVLQQSLIYSTFIAHLLCSEIGERWWKIFRDNRAGIIPNELKIDSVSLMPADGNSPECEDFSPISVPIPGFENKVKLYPYKLYYERDAQGNPCKFTGTNKSNTNPNEGSYKIVLP